MLLILASKLADQAGWIPAIILPTASLLQLIKIWTTRSVVGVSAWAWGLFGLANIGTYIYLAKPTEVQSILGFLVTAILNFVIVGMVIARRRRKR